MIVAPYRQPPRPPTIVLVTPDGAYIDEHGQILQPAQLTAGHRCFLLWDIARQLIRAGRGESLCWNNEDVRWRPEAHPDESDRWVTRHSDAYVLRWPFDEDVLPLPELMAELVKYRDWLAREGAAPTGTTGSASMSLLRAKLEGRLVCSMGARPPLLQTRGGRQETGPDGPGTYRGVISNFDLPAAYASTIGTLHYGGVWQTSSELPRPWLEYAAEGAAVFVKARVSIPELTYGPLIRRLPRRVTALEMALYAATVESDGSSFLYPTRRRVQGTWTWQELEQAQSAGCTVEKTLEVWVHRAAWQPFLPWWEAVQNGRALGGVAGAFAKMTGNALWGRFAMDLRVQGRRTIRTAKGSRLLKQNPFQWPAHDLAETVSGRVRAALYGAMATAGRQLVSAHTDGLWVRDRVDLLEGWRVKKKAVQLDLLDPQTLRYWHWHGQPAEHVMAGVPFAEQPVAFADRWQEAGL